MEKFSTPGHEQTRSLLLRMGFGPRPGWTWTQNGGRGSTSVVVAPKHVAKVITQWLRVRNDVAHGHTTIHSLAVLTAVRDPNSSEKAKGEERPDAAANRCDRLRRVLPVDRSSHD
ncbi:hypothetical protein [Streptomyces sp. NPDC002082]|uniref:hypothetical protein n=1 Tax=Streptomyces sp. NPDC002082 TaxID=3154772 RepID=UPI0033241AA9